MLKFATCFFITVISLACQEAADSNTIEIDTTVVTGFTDTIPSPIPVPSQQILRKADSPQMLSAITGLQLVDFAKTLLGTPYKYASSDPFEGFDCSGFISYVFKHFQVEVPRSSVDFTNTGQEVSIQNAQTGDLILFTGTVDSIRTVGHMGIITENRDTLKFIHSSAEKAFGVTVSFLNKAYQRRFVKVIRVLYN